MTEPDPIPEKQRALINAVARGIDDAFNPGWDSGRERRVGFALLTYQFGEHIEGTGRVNYIGNGKREDVLVALKEVVARWEGKPLPSNDVERAAAALQFLVELDMTRRIPVDFWARISALRGVALG